MRKMYEGRALLATVAATALFLPLTAAAQDARPPLDDDAGVSDIVVTAQRTRGTVQTTPVAITAADSGLLADRQISDMRNIGDIVPGLSIQPVASVANAPRIIMRGAGQESTGILYDPAVGVYIDNVYMPRLNGSFFDFFDIERLEVLRGPQGTLYGRNSSGGAIKIVTRTPSATAPEFAGDLAVGSFNLFQVRGYASAPLVEDKLAASLSVIKKVREGFIKSNVYDDGNVGDINLFALRGKLHYTPSSAFELTISGDYTKDKSDSGVGVPLTVRPQVTNPNATPGRDLYSTEFATRQMAPLESYGASANARWELSDALALVSVTGYHHLELAQVTPLWQWTTSTDGNGNVTTVENGSNYTADDWNFSQEFNLEYQKGAVEAVAGLYYFKEKGRMERLASDSTATYGAVRSLRRSTEALAAFGQATVEVLDGVKLTAGIRWTKETGEFSQYYPATFNEWQRARKSFDAFTPKFGVNYQVNPDLMLYASYTKGFKSGGFNEVTPSINSGTGLRYTPELYMPEEVQSYEGGVKFTSADRKFRVNLAVFQADYNDLQLPALIPGTAVSTTRNASNARIRGIEIEPVWKLSSAFEVYGALSFSDSKYTASYTCANAYGSYVECSGRKIKGVIPIQATYGISLTPNLDIPGKLRINADWRYTSKYYNNVSNDLNITQAGELSLFNASVKWTSADGHWSAALEGRNLADRKYYLSALQLSNATQPAVTIYPGEPRSVTLRLGWNF